MADHDTYIARGYCPAIYGDIDDEHWCRLPAEDDGLHHDALGVELPHVAPWEYNFPKSETMVRWEGPDDAPVNVKYVVWKPAPDPTTNWPGGFDL